MKKRQLYRGVPRAPFVSEPLEDRLLLSAVVSGAAADGLAQSQIATPTFIDLGAISKRADANPDALSAPFDPSQIAQAYGINLISFAGTAGTGAGQTIAIVDAYNDPAIISDANSFSATFGLQQFNVAGGPTLTVLNQSGGTSLPANARAGTWDVEESLDVEWAHAIAPDANIVLFEASNNSDTNLFDAVTEAADYTGVSVVSMSWSGSEFSSETFFDSDFLTPANHQGVTFFAATGDTGAAVGYPAVSPNVVAVGGTSLTINDDGSYGGESAWSDGGGGVSQYESQPSYQTGKVNGVSTTNRATPDVSMDADPNTGVYVLDSFYSSEYYLQVGGTSLSTPMWAALVAIANQGRALNGLPTLTGAQTLAALYNLAPSNFHDITTGSNGHPATVGYDLATGLGTPVANLLVPALAGYATVANQYLFYYGSSAFDNSATAPSSADLNAIATDKTALLPGQTATFSNVSSYLDGINGILIDFANLPAGVTFSAKDFQFNVGNNSTPSTWAAGPAPAAVATWSSGGNTFADIVWPNGAIRDEWLQVTVLVDANTHLASNDVFYFGNLVGATGASVTSTSNGPLLQVTSTDVELTEDHLSEQSTVPITSLYDFNRDGQVTSTDVEFAALNLTEQGGLELITLGSATPATTSSGSSTVASSDSRAGDPSSALLQKDGDTLHRRWHNRHT